MICRIAGILIFLTAIFSHSLTFAQSDTIPARSLFIRFTPHYLLINGLHADIEIPQKKINPRRSFLFSPRFYSGKTRTVDFFSGRHWEDEDNAKVRGYGAEIGQRWYVSKNLDFKKEVTYLSFGVNLTHFDLDFGQKGWVEETGSDGLQYVRYRMQPYREKINRWGATVLFGAQSPFIIPKTIFDIYLGLGYHHSNASTNYSQLRYDLNSFDFGYTGLYFLTGIKLGVVL